MNNCRTCNAILDDQTYFDDKTLKPKEGDFSVCAYCGTISTYDSEMNLQPLPSDELIKLNEEDPETFDKLIAYQKAIFKLI